MQKALGYMRTSSATNVGADKDSEPRQRAAIEAAAKHLGYEIALEDWFYDAAVSGVDPIETRPGFAKMLDRIEGNGGRTIIVEDASRFARDMIASELGILTLQQRGVTLLASNGDSLTENTDPSKVMMRQIAAAFAQYEKARLVARLKRSRDKIRSTTGRCEGRSPIPPETIAEAKRLASDGKLSLRAISTQLAQVGHTVAVKGVRSGRPYGPASVSRMIGA